MPKIIIITISFFLSSTLLNAQMSFLPKGPRIINTFNVIDSGIIRIKYVLNKNMAGTKKYDDILLLDIGTELSKFYSYKVFESDSTYSAYLKDKPHAQSVPFLAGRNPTVSNKYFWSDLYKYYDKKQLKEFSYMPKGISNYYYSEEIPKFNWTIYNDTSIILSYLCQKATCEFRGRKYTAWFTSEIPIDNGPWKFCGLPGLIMEVFDENKLFHYECFSIEKPKQRFSIVGYDYSAYKKITRDKFNEIWISIFKNYFQMVGVIFNGAYKPQKIIYHPVELN